METSEILNIYNNFKGDLLPPEYCRNFANKKLDSLNVHNAGVRQRKRISDTFYFDHLPEFQTYILYRFALQKKRVFIHVAAIKEIPTDKGKVFFFYQCIDEQKYTFHIVTAHTLDRLSERLNINNRLQALMKLSQEFLAERLTIHEIKNNHSYHLKTNNLIALGSWAMFETDNDNIQIIFKIIMTAITHDMLTEKQKTFLNVAERKAKENAKFFIFDNLKYQSFYAQSLSNTTPPNSSINFHTLSAKHLNTPVTQYKDQVDD